LFYGSFLHVHGSLLHVHGSLFYVQISPIAYILHPSGVLEGKILPEPDEAYVERSVEWVGQLREEMVGVGETLRKAGEVLARAQEIKVCCRGLQWVVG